MMQMILHILMKKLLSILRLFMPHQKNLISFLEKQLKLMKELLIGYLELLQREKEKKRKEQRKGKVREK